MNARCPHCGSYSYGPILDGSVAVCPDCGYDTEHGTDGVCPGGKHPKDANNVCCDPCWARIPTRIPGWGAPWRTGLRDARTIRAWGRTETILVAVKAWLVEHQERTNPMTAPRPRTSHLAAPDDSTVSPPSERTNPQPADPADELESVLAWAAYQWDCPCGEVNTIDHDPSGETATCEVCNLKVRIESVR